MDAGWGDYYTAHELGEAFTADGWEVIYAERHEDHWYDIDREVDLLISLLDAYDVRRKPDGAFSIAWVRNWVDRWADHPWFDDYDLVATSSQRAADALALRTRFLPSVVRLATNPERFHPGPPNPLFESDYAFTGNNWGFGRDLIRLLDVHGDERFMIFGKGWDKEPRAARHWRGHLSYELLPEVYRSTKIVLDDTATPTLPHAFLNGRVFDALASGALVLTDNVEGSNETFDGLVPTYAGPGELRAQIDRYLGDERQRVELVHQLREQVVSNHSYRSRPGEFLALALDQVDRPRAAIKIPVPKEKVRAQWGDTHFGEGLASALTALGMPTEVHILPEWDAPARQAADVVIHVRGLTRYTPKSAHVNVIWIISHPDDVSVRECEKYDLVLVASRQYADWLRPQLEAPVVYLPQATDARRFRPVARQEELASEVLFVGNTRGQRRPAVDWAVEAGLPLVVYGEGWDGSLPPRFVRGSHFPNERLAQLYSSADLVLNDHWPDMREQGFISNRIFDALASGAVVVSDRVAGLGETFGDLVPTYSNAVELEDVIRSLLKDEERRAGISRAASALVLEQHTFAHRAERIIELLQPLLSGRAGDLDGATLSL
jgi:spore maturation protein CgeB